MESPVLSQLPPITVIIPVFNGENYLRETLESVFAQNYAPAEIIVVDDGSKDGTVELAKSFGDRVRVFSQPNAGLAAARNQAISLAKTEWVALVDHDDLWEKNHLRNIAQIVAANPDADLCYTGVRLLIADAASGRFVPAEKPLAVPGADVVKQILLERCPFKPSCVALRKSTVERAGGFDPRRRHGEDWDMWLRLIRSNATFVHCPEPTLLYRVHAASMTNKPLFALEQTRRMLDEELMAYLPAWKRETLGRKVISRLEAEAAILLRENGMPGALPLMLKSIARHPFHESSRYKIALHMVLRGYPRSGRPTA